MSHSRAHQFGLMLFVASALTLAIDGPAAADPGAAITCPPYYFLNDINYAVNPSFEVVGPDGPKTSWQNGQPWPVPSAAAGWFMHSNNAGAPVQSRLIPSKVPGPGGTSMLHFIAGGNEGGIYQYLQNPPTKLMFSAWVYVRSGHIGLQAQGGVTGPHSFSTKTGEWEQLRVCSDGSVPTDMLVIYNQDPAGEFFVDRVEVRAIP